MQPIADFIRDKIRKSFDLCLVNYRANAEDLRFGDTSGAIAMLRVLLSVMYFVIQKTLFNKVMTQHESDAVRVVPLSPPYSVSPPF